MASHFWGARSSDGPETMTSVRKPSDAVPSDELEHASPSQEIGRCEPERYLVGVMNPLTVSTAQLRTFLPLHLQPINLVVFQGSHVY